MPPKMKLPKVQNIDLKKVKKNQEILDKKKIKVRKSKLEAPLRDSKLENPAKYIKDDTDYFIPPQLKKRNESAKYTDYDKYVNFIRGLFPPQYQEDPTGHHFYPDPHTDSTDGIKKEVDDMNVDENFNTFQTDYFKQENLNNIENEFKASPFGFNSSNVSSIPDYNNFFDDNGGVEESKNSENNIEEYRKSIYKDADLSKKATKKRNNDLIEKVKVRFDKNIEKKRDKQKALKEQQDKRKEKQLNKIKKETKEQQEEDENERKEKKLNKMTKKVKVRFDKNIEKRRDTQKEEPKKDNDKKITVSGTTNSALKDKYENIMAEVNTNKVFLDLVYTPLYQKQVRNFITNPKKVKTFRIPGTKRRVKTDSKNYIVAKDVMNTFLRK